MRYQEKIGNNAENKILRECRREMDSNEWENTRWGKEMKKLLQEKGIQNWERKAAEDRREDTLEAGKKKFKEIKEKERMRKIKESNSAKDYKKWMLERRDT